MPKQLSAEELKRRREVLRAVIDSPVGILSMREVFESHTALEEELDERDEEVKRLKKRVGALTRIMSLDILESARQLQQENAALEKDDEAIE